MGSAYELWRDDRQPLARLTMNAERPTTSGGRPSDFSLRARAQVGSQNAQRKETKATMGIQPFEMDAPSFEGTKRCGRAVAAAGNRRQRKFARADRVLNLTCCTSQQSSQMSGPKRGPPRPPCHAERPPPPTTPPLPLPNRLLQPALPTLPQPPSQSCRFSLSIFLGDSLLHGRSARRTNERVARV